MYLLSLWVHVRLYYSDLDNIEYLHIDFYHIDLYMYINL